MLAAPARLWRMAPLLLATASLSWAGNAVIGRAVHATIPPVTLAFWRWTGAFFVVLPFALEPLRRDWPVLLRRWRSLAMLSFTGVGVFNTLLYRGLDQTTAINGLLLQSAMPLMILLASGLIYRERPTAHQTIAILISLAGVAVIAAHGSLAQLGSLSVNPGDAWILAAVASYALYSSLLRGRPPVHALSFLAASFALGALMLLPLYLLESLTGATVAITPGTLAAFAYVAVMPSFVGYLCFNRGVELIGAARGGQYVHLVPVFGTLLAMAFLGERLHTFHLAGIALIATGLALAARR
jgi:drug/metabolite transporter (DMT)-like permease